MHAEVPGGLNRSHNLVGIMRGPTSHGTLQQHAMAKIGHEGRLVSLFRPGHIFEVL